MIKLKNVLIICGLAVFAVVGISIVRAIAAPALWEQSWPANTGQTQTLTSKQSSAALTPSPVPAQSNFSGSEPASSSPVVSAVSPSNQSQSSTPPPSSIPVKPE